MENLIGLTTSAASGGVFGLLGTALGRVAGFAERRQAHAHEAARWAHERELAALNQATEREAARAKRSLADTTGQWNGLAASIAAEAAIGQSYAWVNAVRGLTRPVLTLLLWVIAGAIWLGADAAGRSAITETATFAATAATLWWFGDRGPRRDG